jgi:hypothetical protein
MAAESGGGGLDLRSGGCHRIVVRLGADRRVDQLAHRPRQWLVQATQPRHVLGAEVFLREVEHPRTRTRPRTGVESLDPLVRDEWNLGGGRQHHVHPPPGVGALESPLVTAAVGVLGE